MSEVLVVLIIFGAIFGRGILNTFFNHREKIKAIELEKAKLTDKSINSDLVSQIERLTNRVEVLEKIITDEKYQLEREIAKL
ncbi:nitrite reductase [Vibrio parahaemolyticus]|uniref:nitrite reductase n=1 Tax=Vibrio mediterranei TaxID=689 RepID=UPI0040689889